MVIRGPVLRRHLGHTAAGVAVAIATAFLAVVILTFVDTDGWGARTLPGDSTVTELLALVVIAVGTVLATAVDVSGDTDGRLNGVRFGSNLVATSAGALAIGFGYLRFWCDRATAVVTGLIDRNHDVSHWSARVLLADSGRQVDFDHYSRDGDGVAIGHEFEVIADPRGWTEPYEPLAVDMFYPAAGVTVALFLALFLLSAWSARRELLRLQADPGQREDQSRP